jgi:hypothetical protein
VTAACHQPVLQRFPPGQRNQELRANAKALGHADEQKHRSGTEIADEVERWSLSAG